MQRPPMKSWVRLGGIEASWWLAKDGDGVICWIVNEVVL